MPWLGASPQTPKITYCPQSWRTGLLRSINSSLDCNFLISCNLMEIKTKNTGSIPWRSHNLFSRAFWVNLLTFSDKGTAGDGLTINCTIPLLAAKRTWSLLGCVSTVYRHWKHLVSAYEKSMFLFTHFLLIEPISPLASQLGIHFYCFRTTSRDSPPWEVRSGHSAVERKHE